ncbi:MAG: polyprenol monophosphomannose synthase [Planctomycetes bacterium]|nr:polyprenol monophosphomannose synthase [Planctomycetota bacterium]
MLGSRPLACVPTLDEASSLPALLEALARERARLPCALDLLVIDDRSPDGTAAVARGFAATHPWVHVLERDGPRGLGHAYRAGFAWALARDYALVAQLDADGSHDPRYLPALFAAARDADLVLGSRYVPGGACPDWGLGRRALSRGAASYVRWFLGGDLRDPTSGYRVAWTRVLRAIEVENTRSDGYAFQVEVALRASRAGFAIHELPIVFRDRRVGQSKLSWPVVWEAIGLPFRR